MSIGDDSVMRTTCPTCDTAYTIPDDRIGPKGRKVRCTRCGEEWRVGQGVDSDAATADSVDRIASARATVEPTVPTAPAARSIDAWDADAAADASITAPPPRDPVDEADDVAMPRAAMDEAVPDTDAADADAAEAAATPAPGPQHPLPVHIRVKKRSFRPRLPVLPAVMSRFTPFFGPLVFATACLVLAGLVVFRTAIVATAPGLAGFYAAVGLQVNLRGLTFGTIETLREIDNGQPVLVVEGSLANTTGESREVPSLRFALRDADAQELYAWSVDPRATTIAAGDRLRFRTRLVAPPERASDLQVRFIERRNRQAGLP